MKKFLLALSLLTLLAGCEESTPIVENPQEESSQKVMAPQMFYIADLDISEEGEYLLTQNFVTWLSDEDGTCRNNGSAVPEDEGLPECNPNGFLIIEGDAQMQVIIPAETSVKINNLVHLPPFIDPETLTVNPDLLVDDEGMYQITLAQLQTAMVENPEFFEVTPFQLSYGTVTLDGQEMSDQVSAINEIYIP